MCGFHIDRSRSVPGHSLLLRPIASLRRSSWYAVLDALATRFKRTARDCPGPGIAKTLWDFAEDSAKGDEADLHRVIG